MDLTSQSVRVNLATRHATLYGLDPLIVCAVIEQESDWDTWAIRYEPAFFSRYIQPIQSGPRPLSATEAAARAFSFGLMQIMGQTARELGVASLFLVELCDPDTGVDFGCRKLQKCFQDYSDPEAALLRYNGGANSNYGKQVLARVAKYAPGS